jgi:hypothetical protein
VFGTLERPAGFVPLGGWTLLGTCDAVSDVSPRSGFDLETVAEVGNHQFVAGSEDPLRDPTAVDPGAVGAVQVSNEQFLLTKGQAAMAA